MELVLHAKITPPTCESEFNFFLQGDNRVQIFHDKSDSEKMFHESFFLTPESDEGVQFFAYVREFNSGGNVR